jgi:hypothetical protein
MFAEPVALPGLNVCEPVRNRVAPAGVSTFMVLAVAALVWVTVPSPPPAKVRLPLVLCRIILALAALDCRVPEISRVFPLSTVIVMFFEDASVVPASIVVLAVVAVLKPALPGLTLIVPPLPNVRD